MDLIENGRLGIFNKEFEIDYSLPKYDNTPLENSIDTASFRSNRVNAPTATFDIGNTSISSEILIDLDAVEVVETANMPWWKKIFTLFNYEKMYKTYGEKAHNEAVKKQKEEEENQITIGEFFAQVKTAMSESEIKDYTQTIENYLKEMDKALKIGQTALFEEMKNAVSRMKIESILRAKRVKTLSEEQLVKLGQKSKKGIKIDYLKNFTRIIPDEVLDKKLEADDLLIYDNYVVVHFDPNNQASKKTEQEKKEEQHKEKDPILFGVVAGSTNLYFVADWIDEYCDLTLDKAIEIINSAE